MTRRMKLILTRPVDDSLEAFENFRRITALKPAQSKTGLIKDDLVNEWEKFWEFLKIKPDKKYNQIIRIN
ncbi:MAG: hypothetical protein IH619_04760 [Ignavibacterium sp.]|nr:hypothetical protein [Ignavibacterium sp.]